MNLLLNKSTCNPNSDLKITGSKSETNRLLLLQALFPGITLENTSKSDDSDVMQEALTIDLPSSVQSNLFVQVQSSLSSQAQSSLSSQAQSFLSSRAQSRDIDVHHAGTAMRFLTAYFAQKQGHEVVLTGSARMQQRPISILVDALTQLGADISYVKNTGFPPIKIIGKKLIKHQVTMSADVSSQYISALLLIAPKLQNGLELNLVGKITSLPYIKMTLALLNEIGVQTSFIGNKITVKHLSQIPPLGVRGLIESDWSSASYFYSIVALSDVGTQISLSSYKQSSLQGDSVLADIYKDFGVETIFNDNKTITIRKITNHQPSTINHQLCNSPDIAQTIAITAFGLGLACNLTGLHTLKIKETDRLEALKIELTKLGASITVTNDSLHLQISKAIRSNISIATYQDHRMAMSFAPLALKIPIQIENADVVSKSFPTFWIDLQSIGFQISNL